ncbi:unnamed protein product, partial [Mesorhabditis spiculigera]
MTFRTEMDNSFLHNETTEGDRSSVRSSEASGGAGGGRGSPGEELKERKRLEEKIENTKLKISKVNLSCEADVEQFLEMSRAAEMSRGIANPQMTRLKQHFEKNNKKNAQDLESLQKKLATYEHRLQELGNSNVLETSSRSGNIVQGIKKTGATVRDLTGHVIAAPLNMIKNQFGSADNINDGEPSHAVGQSVFYAKSDHAQPSTSQTPNSKSSTLPPGLRMPTSPTSSKPPSNYQTPESRFATRKGDSDRGSNDSPVGEDLALLLKETMAELREAKEANAELMQKFNELNDFVQKELKFFDKSQQQDSFRYQSLEGQLNETIDLHQAEMNSLRSEMNTLTDRLDYQYNDRFKKVEERVENTQNHVARMEHSFKQTMSERQDQAVWGGLLLHGANVLVEILKLVLFVVASTLDFFKPFAGTRTRTGFLLLGIVVALIVMQNVDIVGMIFRKKRGPVLAAEVENLTD